MRRRALAVAVMISIPAALMIGAALTADTGVTRVYYVAADEVDWNYLPMGEDALTGNPPGDGYRIFGIPDTIMALTMTKAVYREYTDSTFSAQKPRPPEWQHLGLIGPVFRGEVGDTIVVVFKNHTRHPVSMHPHGVFYGKDSEGAPYSDGTTAKHDDGVPPGDTHRYLWPVPERAGPGPRQPNSIVWPYHSHTAEIEDVNAGLIGAMIITRRGHADAEGRPTDVDREYVMMYGAQIENTTKYFKENMARYGVDTTTLGDIGPTPSSPPGPGSPFFQFFGYVSINGFLYANLPLDDMTMDEGDRVRWYLFSSTSFDDFHTPTWHGGTVLINGRRTDVADLSGPLLMLTADMVADNPGTWQFHCHFGEHMEGGMTSRYRVRPKEPANSQ